MPDEYKVVRQYGPFNAIVEATDKTWQLMKLTVSMLGKLITGDVKLNNLSGPISIAKGAGMTAELGVVYYLPFLALISVNLGIINLFPLPVLDGGHLLFLAIEKIKGRTGIRAGSRLLLSHWLDSAGAVNGACTFQ